VNNQVGQKGVTRLDVGHLMPTKLDHSLPSFFLVMTKLHKRRQLRLIWAIQG